MPPVVGAVVSVVAERETERHHARPRSGESRNKENGQEHPDRHATGDVRPGNHYHSPHGSDRIGRRVVGEPNRDTERHDHNDREADEEGGHDSYEVHDLTTHGSIPLAMSILSQTALYHI